MTKKTVRVRKNRVGVGSGLGELEADIMRVVWGMGGATVKDVFEELYPDKHLAYTTIMTVMSRLANKNVLKQDRSGTAYMYTPNVSQEDMANAMITQVVEKVMGGKVAPVVSFLLNKGDIDEKELDRIKQAIQDKKKELAAK
ncbi:MAG: BlaI/MecI/CopY family transcriptional regulator [Candidatus Aquicultor sp.]|nr:BlaI/MecI/CopY family transcriptional regulator [Candidatus Aquicultor sp.]